MVQIELRPVQRLGHVAERGHEKFALPLELAGFEETKISHAVEDDVVQQLDADDCSCSLELAGDRNVACRWFESAAGRVMRYNDARRTVGHRIREDFPWMRLQAQAGEFGCEQQFGHGSS